MEELQAKLERVIKEKEVQAKEEMETRVKEVQARYEGEIDKMRDQYSKVENEGYKKAQTIKLMEIERH